MNAQAQIFHSSDELTWAALAHASALLNVFGGVGGLIAALVIWLTQREKSAWVAFQALQALVFQATILVITVLVVGVAVSQTMKNYLIGIGVPTQESLKNNQRRPGLVRDKSVRLRSEPTLKGSMIRVLRMQEQLEIVGCPLKL